MTKPKPKRKLGRWALRNPKGARITLYDLEKVMGRKADDISEFAYDVDTGSWGRTITFELNKGKKRGGK